MGISGINLSFASIMKFNKKSQTSED